MSRIVSIENGDWHDASYFVIEVADGVDLDYEHEKWRDWYRNQYLRVLDTPRRIEYVSFVSSLIDRGLAKRFEHETWSEP